MVYRLTDSGAVQQIGCIPCGGEQPRDLAIDPSGRWLLIANQDSDTITVFPIDPTTLLADAGAMQTYPCKTPTCISFSPS